MQAKPVKLWISTLNFWTLVFVIGQSTVGGPKWTKIDLFGPKWTKMDHFGPFWPRKRKCWNNVILIKMVVLTILDHFGPARLPTVLRPLATRVVQRGPGSTSRSTWSVPNLGFPTKHSSQAWTTCPATCCVEVPTEGALKGTGLRRQSQRAQNADFCAEKSQIFRRLTPCLAIPIAWYKAPIPVFPRKSIREGASGLFGRWPESPKNASCSKATGSLGCSRARDNFGTLRPSPEKTTCSSPYQFSWKNRSSGLAPSNQNPNPRHVNSGISQGTLPY